MSGCGSSACCLALLDEKNLEEIDGVGVLLQSVSDSFSDRGYGLFCKDAHFVLNSRGRAVGKPWMNLAGSVILLKNCKNGVNGNGGVEQRSRCVRVGFWRLRPWEARVLPENCLNEISWCLIKKLNGLFKKKELQDCQKQHSSTAKRAFKVWYLEDPDSLCCDEGLNDSVEGEGSDSSQGEAVSETSSKEGDSVKFEYQVRYKYADSESKDCGCDLKVADLWIEARSIAYKISMLKDKTIKHFGYLVPVDEIGWVKAGYYRSLPKDYKKKFKNERKKKSRQYFADYLEEKARKNAWFRFWWHPLTQMLLRLFILLFAFIGLSIGLVKLDKILTDRFEDLTSVSAGLFAFLVILFLLFLFGKKITKSENSFSFRKHTNESRKRRLKEWQDGNK